MITLHPPLYFVAGDTWVINGTLRTNSDQPLDLTGAKIVWLFNTPNGSFNYLVLDATVDGGIEVIGNPIAGQVKITVPPEITVDVAPGVFKDWLRVTLANDGGTFTEWNGFIRVAVNPEPAAP